MYAAAKNKKMAAICNKRGNVALASIMRINAQKRAEQKRARAQRRLRVVVAVCVCICLCVLTGVLVCVCLIV